MPVKATPVRLPGYALPRGRIHADFGDPHRSLRDINLRIDYSLSPFRGEGEGEGRAFNSARIASNTAGVFSKTSLFQNRKTRKPLSSNALVRRASYCVCSACWPPSSSTINFSSKQTKSTMYTPFGCWRRNLNCSNWRLRRKYQIRCSASVAFVRSCCGRDFCGLPLILAFSPGGRRDSTPVGFEAGLVTKVSLPHCLITGDILRHPRYHHAPCFQQTRVIRQVER
jgi:hypothetical protein